MRGTAEERDLGLLFTVQTAKLGGSRPEKVRRRLAPVRLARRLSRGRRGCLNEPSVFFAGVKRALFSAALTLRGTARRQGRQLH